jgi:hypothetical protein
LTRPAMAAYSRRVTQNFGSRPKTRAMLLVEAELDTDLEAYLRREYVERGRRLRDIGKDLGFDVGTISRWMAHFEIETRVRTVVA